MKKSILKKYAKLIAVKGANVKKGQSVIVVADLDQPEFVALVVDECYKAGASEVSVEWNYQPLIKLHNRHQSLKTLSTVNKWQEEKLAYRAETLPCMIYLESSDPDGLKGINMEKHAKAQQARYKVIKPYRDRMDNRYQWVIAAVPGEAWAKKVFPGMRTSLAMEKLWEAILCTSRVDDDPMKAWDEHNADLARRCAYLNSLGLVSLTYKASNGTDLRVGLIEDAVFMAGGETTLGTNIFFNPNIPTEEVFITPKKGEAEGIVYSSKPFSYRGQLIENFSVRFEGGKAVQVIAEHGQELLEKMISMDEGAAFLGECALVPFSSPISQSGLLFYNTLFDENAACHLALGDGFTNCLKGFENMSLEECHKKGINDSMIHEDFMIGTSDLSIVGHDKAGNAYPIMKNGEWAF